MVNRALVSRARKCGLWCGAAVAAMSAGSAWAQAAPAPQPPPAPSSQTPAAPAGAKVSGADQATLSEVVVTGTLIRGRAPVGSELIAVGHDKVISAGVMTSNELLATVPQVTNLFQTVPNRRFAIALNQVQIARPNLRNISNDNASSSATLVLFDGHRVATAGITQASIDPDLFPTVALERVDVVTGGGSATYGADAVGGVINFITMRHFDGVKIGARYGFADGYNTWDTNATVGKDWGSGSAYLSYVFSKNDSILGRDRNFIKNVDFTAGGIPTGLTCNLANVTVGGVNYAGPSFTPGTNRCDTSDNSTYVPEVAHHGALAAISQDLNDKVSIDARGFYSQRTTFATAELSAANVGITSTNPYYIPLGPNPTARQTAAFNFNPALGSAAAGSGSTIEEAGAYAEIRADITHDWQLRTLFNYSQSDSRSYIVGINPTALAAAGSAGTIGAAINPYNIAGTNRQLLANLANNDIFAGQALDKLFDFRPVLEGRLFTLPGGDVRLAAGYEFMHDDFRQRTGQNIVHGTIGSVPYANYKRNVQAGFGELVVPIVGEGNAMRGVNSFVLNIAGRYDHYSDFGGTFNPKVGGTYKPVEWFSIRGDWSKAFNAPTPLDQLGSLRNTISNFPFVAFVRPGDNVCFTCGTTVALQGSRPDLQPQKAKTWSVGFDADPPVVPGLHASLSYYHVTFNGLLGTPSSTASTLFANFSDVVITNPAGLTPAQLRAFAAQAPNGSAVIEPLIANNTLVYEAVDFRTANFGNLETNGLDFALKYTRPTDFGNVDASIAGNYILKRTSQVTSSAPMFDELEFNTARLRMQSILGANIGDFRAQVTWNHTSGYDVVRSSMLPQDHVSAFDTVDLFFKYDVKRTDILNDLTISMNINNVLDANPPLYLLTNGGGFNGSGGTFTVGREVIFGISKKF